MAHIRLDLSRTPRKFGTNESLWHEDLYRIFQLIHQHHQSLKAYSDKNRSSSRFEDDEPRQRHTWRHERQRDPDAEDRPFLSIAIFGPSGSGKSSLLRTFADQVNYGPFPQRQGPQAPSKSEDEFKDLNNKLYALRVLHPQRFEKDQDHFLYAFLATALDEEREHREKRRHNQPEALSPVQQSFQELTEFLRVIDKGDEGNEYDPLGLSLERLERHTSGLLLRRRLYAFVDTLADQLAGSDTNSLIFLPVDDADMAPNHLNQILHCYQTYLQHPRLVPIFTFTDRTAEELLRKYYKSNLDVRKQDTQAISPGESTFRLPIDEQLAIQYLTKCFPVRNRIRLGPAPARLQGSLYSSIKDENQDPNCPQGRSVMHLLRTSSYLLFGQRSRESDHAICRALRPSTLRRQFQVVDAMHEASVEPFMTDVFFKENDIDPEQDAAHLKPPKISGGPNAEAAEVEGRHRPWVDVYRRAAWSLLNVHRDVLREYNLHLEDLYSWTPKALRKTILQTLLEEPQDRRRAILRRWRYRADSRRAQVLSLLVAEVFRPWMFPEEPSGDSEFVQRQFRKLSKQNQFKKNELCDQSLRRKLRPGQLPAIEVGRAFTWFIELAECFYLPLSLSPRRPHKSSEKTTDRPGPLIGVGWDLENAPTNAIRATIEEGNLFPTGMMMLDDRKFADALKVPEGDSEYSGYEQVLLRSWCYYGYQEDRYWAAVSFWRGLSLMGLLLEKHEVWKAKDPSGAEGSESRQSRADTEEMEAAEQQEEQAKDGLARKVKEVLRTHLIRGMVPGDLLGEGNKPSKLDRAFEPWNSPALDPGLEKLAGDLANWLCQIDPQVELSGESNTSKIKLITDTTVNLYPWLPLMPMREHQLKRAPQEILPLSCAKNTPPVWSSCFLRRLHGEDVLGSLWPRLNATYLEDQHLKEENSGEQQQKYDHRWTAAIAMESWTEVFFDYWRRLWPIQILLRTCPLFYPFQPNPEAKKQRRKEMELSWKSELTQDLLERHLSFAREAPDLGDHFEPAAKGSEQQSEGNQAESPAQAISQHEVKTSESHLPTFSLFHSITRYEPDVPTKQEAGAPRATCEGYPYSPWCPQCGSGQCQHCCQQCPCCCRLVTECRCSADEDDPNETAAETPKPKARRKRPTKGKSKQP